MKKLNYLNFLILLHVLITIKTKSELNQRLSEIIENNTKIIKDINDNISLYRATNNLFNETKKILKNFSYGNELFEEEYAYMKFISDNKNDQTKLRDESLYHRLIPETLFEYDKNISCYNLIPIKAIAKDDTGNFVSILLLTCQMNDIIISDLLGNTYLIYKTNYKINDIITFKQDDINFFYILSNNYTEIRKFFLSYNIYYNNNTNKSDLNDIIKVDTYAEDEKREKMEGFSYELFDTYKQNINNKKIDIIEDKNISLILNKSDGEYLINIIPVNIKGTNYLMAITNKYSIYKLNYKNLDIIYKSTIESSYVNNISYNLIPIVMNYYYIVFNKSERGYSIIKFDNTSAFLGKCDLFLDKSAEKILNYFFEEKSKTLYIISSLNKLYLSIPMLIPSKESSNKNSCKNIFISELNIINKEIYDDINNDYDLTLLEKKLMITKDGINYEIIDITKVGEVDDNNKLQTKFFDLNKYINNKNNYSSFIMKDNKKYFYLKQISEKALMLFIFYEKNAKIYTSEGQSFNFKVPIILVAFAIILIWNYIKSKSEGSTNDFNKFKSKYD